MDLGVYNWLDQTLLNGIKYIIVAHYFLGFEFSKNKKKYLLLIYFLILLIMEYQGNPDVMFLYYFVWGMVLLIGVFKRDLKEKIKAFFIIWVLVAFVDTVSVPFYILFPVTFYSNENIGKVLLLDSIGVVLWGIMASKGKQIQRYTKNFWKNISNKEYLLSLVVLTLCSVFVGGMQGYIDNTMSEPMTERVFIFGFLVMVVSITVLVSLLKTMQSKRQLEEINQLNIRYLELQKKYYEDSLKQYEDMRSFRHDINHHLYILSELGKEDKIDELKGYVKKMAEDYETMKGVHTGSFIADCIISQTLYKLQKKEEFHFDLGGHFPEDFFLEDIDFCILLSNLLENAVEALEKVTGKAFLQIEIKSFRQWFFLIIRNNTVSEQIDFQTTSKSDKRNHGFGVQSINRIVEKYHGNVIWNCENGVVEVKIKFDQSVLR